jgi:hypothetical protein
MSQKPKPLPAASHLRECFVYEPTTGALTWRERPREHFATVGAWKMWNTRFANRPAGYRDGDRFAVRIDGRHEWVQRVIWKLVTGEEPAETIDHHDGNGCDNRWDNLRPATRAEQSRNRGLRVDNKTGYRGVHPLAGRWSAVIGGRYLGLFNTPAEASVVYEQASRERFGAFHRDLRQSESKEAPRV